MNNLSDGIKEKAKRIVVGLSGGVDSSVAALLLQEQGFEIEGLFMKNWQEDKDDHYCPAAQDVEDAQKICDLLNIPLHTLNFSQEYWEQVFEHTLTEYRAGRTPNPDILCNREIKFKTFLEYALNLGADAIATGHYAQILQAPTTYQLQKAEDRNKDQSYFLYALGQKALSKTLFPIGHLDKPTVRALAQKAGFPNADKKDSTGICFIGERKFKTFLNQYLPTDPGPIETPEQEIIGQHEGLMFYTLGQRQGLGIGGRSNTENNPWYVVAKDRTRNALIVVQGDSHPLLYSQTLSADQMHWISDTPPTLPLRCTAKIRYRQADEPAIVETESTDLSGTRYTISFEKPQRAIAPGQSVVLYQKNICLGGGIIQ